jgi:hypothetical protein
MHNKDNRLSSIRLLKVLFALLNSDIAEVVTLVWETLQRFFTRAAAPGIYEVLEHEVTLELKNTKGSEALYRKRQRVRFLQDNVIAYQDKAWGDGEIFAAYRCSPGVAVDRCREGHYYRILISLRSTKNRGDEEVFHIERKINDGFTQPTEDLQVEIDHRTHHLTMRVIFPVYRPPKAVSVLQQNAARSQLLGGNAVRILPDGRREVTWGTTRPKLFEAYLLRWEW